MITTLVTGGAGFIGRKLLRASVAQGDEVVSFDLNDPTIPDVLSMRGDLSLWAEVVDAVARSQPERIFHCGGLLASSAESNVARGLRINADGTFNVLEAARLFGVRQVVFASTISTYGEGVSDPVPEGAPQRPLTIYGISKVYGERLGEYYARRYGLDFRGVRFPSVIGPGRLATGGSAYTSLMIDEPVRGRPYVVPVEERTVMPILYVDDAVRVLLEISQSPGELPRHVYNIAGLSPAAGEIAAEVRRAVPDAAITFAPDPVTQAVVDSWPSGMDDSPARAEWGWDLGTNLPALIDRFVAAARTQTGLTPEPAA